MSIKIVVFLILGISARSYGQLFQNPDENGVLISVAVGYMQSKIEGSYVDYQLRHYWGRKPELARHTGIEAEVAAKVNIFKFIYVKTGLGFNEQGGEIKYNNLVYPIDVSLRYIYLPVSIGVHLASLNRFSFAAEGGLQLSQEISSEQEFQKGTIIKNRSKTFIPAYTYSLLVQYSINDLLKIQGSYKRLNSLSHFYEQEYFESYISMKTNAESYSVGVLWSLK